MYQGSKKGCENKGYSAAIFKQSKVARNRVRIVYRTGGYKGWPRIGSFASNLGLFKSLKNRALTFCANLESSLVSGLDVAGEERNLHLYMKKS